MILHQEKYNDVMLTVSGLKNIVVVEASINKNQPRKLGVVLNADQVDELYRKLGIYLEDRDNATDD